MSATRNFSCLYCGRNNFMSKNALTRHQGQGICHERQLAMQQERFPPSTPPVVETVLNNYEDDNSYSSDDMLPCPPSPPAKRAVFLRDVADIPAHDVDKVTMQIGPLFADTNSSESEEEGTSNKYASYAGGFKAYEANSDASHDSLANDDYSEEDTMFMGENNKELGANAPILTGPDHSMRDGFREYVAYAKTNFAELTEEEKSAIRILHILKSKNAPMNAYESITVCFGTLNRATSFISTGLWATTVVTSAEKKYTKNWPNATTTRGFSPSKRA